MKKSLYLKETKHYLVYKTFIFLLFFPLLPPAHRFFKGMLLHLFLKPFLFGAER